MPWRMEKGELANYRPFMGEGGQRSPKDCAVSALICLLSMVEAEEAGGGAPRPEMLNRANKYQRHLATLRFTEKAWLLFGNVLGCLWPFVCFKSKATCGSFLMHLQLSIHSS